MTTIIEQQTRTGAYDLNYEVAIVEHPEHGRLLARAGFGGGNIEGMTYRWRHGIVAALRDTDTLDSLHNNDWNEHTTEIEAICAGQDNDRPVLEWDGEAIEAMMDHANPQ
jgi:hypothetical protein